MNTIKQLAAVTILGVKSFSERIASNLVAASCVTLAVAVLLGTLSLSHSVQLTIESSSRPDRVVFLSKGAQLEDMSAIPRTALAAIEQLPGIRRTEQGLPILSADVEMLPPFRERASEKRSRVVVRGVGEENAALRPEIVIVEGRMFRSGLNEVIVGRQAQEKFVGLYVGDTIKLRNTPFAVVGIFEANGTVRESEILTDVQALISIRPTARYQSITVLLNSAADVPNFVNAVNENPRIEATAVSEPDYVARRAKEATQLMEFMAYLVGAIMAAAATFSAANAMLTVVHARRMEFATLRAIGFGSPAVVVAICLEALAIAAVGALVGTAIVSLILNGLPFSSRMVTTPLQIDRELILIGALWACAIGLIGALVPAIHAARQSIVSALRES